MKDKMYVSNTDKKTPPVGAKTPLVEKDYKVFKSGSITEVTLGDSTFQVVDAHRLEAMFQKISMLEGRIIDMSLHQQRETAFINQLQQQVTQLNAEITKLKNERKDDGFGSREITY